MQHFRTFDSTTLQSGQTHRAPHGPGIRGQAKLVVHYLRDEQAGLAAAHPETAGGSEEGRQTHGEGRDWRGKTSGRPPSIPLLLTACL